MSSLDRMRGLAPSAKLFLAILGIALLVRIASVGATTNYPLVTDSLDYHRQAVSISQGEGYPESIVMPDGGPSAFRPPLYPYFMGTIYAVAGPRWHLVRIAQAFLGTLSVALIGLLAYRIWGAREALVASAIAAVYPPLVISGAAILVESVFVPLALGALVAAFEYRRDPSRYGWLLVIGALAGMATLARSNGAVLLLPLLVALWPVVGTEWRRRALRLGTVPAVAALVVAPWAIRNATELDAFVPVSSMSGYALAGTYNQTSLADDGKPASWRPPEEVPEFTRVFAPGNGVSELEMDRELRERSLDFAVDHPRYVAEVGFWNTARVFDLTGFDHPKEIWRYSGVSPGIAVVGVLGFYLVGAFALGGAFTRAARRAPAFLWMTPVLLLLSVVFVADSAGRYRAPLEPFIILFAALGALALWDRRGRGLA